MATPWGGGHVHEVLAHLVAGDLVVGHQDEVGAHGAGPLSGDLAVNEAVVDAHENDVGLCHNVFLSLLAPFWGGI